MKELINIAYAKGIWGESVITAQSNPCTIKVGNKPHYICKTIHEEIILCDCYCVEKCYIYQNGVNVYNKCSGTMIDIDYGIFLKYRDCCGILKTIRRENHCLVYDLNSNFNVNTINVSLPNPIDVNLCGDVAFINAVVKITTK